MSSRLPLFRLSGYLLIILGVLISTTQRTPAAQPDDLLKEFRHAQLLIETTTSGCVLFNVYIATSSQQKSQGLMYIRSMAADEGMLFIYAQPTQISMWMKNTLIPLDMLFIDNTSRISSIHENAVPLSEAIIQSKTIVVGVLELNGGAAQRYGITPGNRLIFPAG
jgi:uncharacterized membrane protein (UPF0127 family)